METILRDIGYEILETSDERFTKIDGEAFQIEEPIV